jgi:hypothetical protein
MGLAAGKSGSNVEQLGDKGCLGSDVVPANPPHLPLPHHRHNLVACQGSSRCPKAAEAEPRSRQAFYAIAMRSPELTSCRCGVPSDPANPSMTRHRIVFPPSTRSGRRSTPQVLDGLT